VVLVNRGRLVAAVAVLTLPCAVFACGGSRYGDFSDVPTRKTCELNLVVPNMACEDACPVKVKSALFNVEGVRRVDVDFGSRTAVVDAFYPACSAEGYEHMMASLASLGYEARIVSSRPLMGWETQ